MWKDKEFETPETVRGNIAAYRAAVEDFSKHASEFLKCVPMLVETRGAYQRAMSISAEVRKVLDTGDDTLQKLMKQIEDAVVTQLGNRPEKKKPEVVRVETISSNETENMPKVLP